ncbi:2-oxoacid:acceptor oxidoreductase subunit alpha [Patescibacteria group bacterium]|nr:2-oxoacid:acceptor oxidoreductase subunit alpha [Patescibacteria group bacterium]
MEKDFSIIIGGAAGQGSRRAGLLIAKAFQSLGYYVFVYDEYQSLVRGGHSFSSIRVSSTKKNSSSSEIDFLIALDQRTWEEHRHSLKKEGQVFYNHDYFQIEKEKRAQGIVATQIVEKEKGKKIMENISLVAFFLGSLGFSEEALKTLFRKEFNKFQEINLKIAQKSFEKSILIKKIPLRKKKQEFSLLTGNQALAQGAIKAGLEFYFAYPMTPATGILHYLAGSTGRKAGIKTVQMENELAVANAALGSAYAGKPTMLATSGGGLALMGEAFSLGVQAEIPLLFINSQRPAPASGVPTYTAQGDLSFSLGLGHGDIVKFLVAPGDAEEAAYWAGKLLSLSWEYQTPSLLLIDKQISESTFSFDPEILKKISPIQIFPQSKNKSLNYQRYEITKNGTSSLAFPGQKGIVVKANSYEHLENGLTTEQEIEIQKMQDKRLRKYQAMQKVVNQVDAVKVYGNKKSSQAILVWGSTKGPAREVAEELKIKMIQPLFLEPFPEKRIKAALQGVEHLVLIEGNALGQLEGLLKSYQIIPQEKILKYNSRPFLASEIKAALNKIYKNERSK